MIKPYTSREEKAKAVAEHYAQYLRGSILDVGCSKKYLKAHLSGAKYIGVDINKDEKPDKVINLERQRLPFRADTFDCVICLDVLEHLDRPQDVMGELVRVSKKHVIVSLPNNWADLRCFQFSRNGFSGKFYGLPQAYPQDRHKWFFSYDEAVSFLRGSAERLGCTVVKIEGTSPYLQNAPLRNTFLRFIAALAPRFFNRFFVHTVWCIFEK